MIDWIDILKKYIIRSVFLIFLVLSITSCDKSNNFTVKGSLDNLTSNEVLISYFKKDSLIVDTVWSNSKNRFLYESKIDTLTSVTFYFNEQSSSVLVFVNPKDKISMKGDAAMPDLIRVNGNEINDELTGFKLENKDLLEYRLVLLENYKNSDFESDSAKTGVLLPEFEELKKINSVNQDLILKAEEFIENNPSKLSSLILINELFANQESLTSFDRVMEYLKEDVLKTEMGLNLKNYLDKMKRSAEGAAMPYFQIKDIKGDTLNSYDFRGKNLLLSFISSVGAESRETVEALKDVYDNVNKDSVEFISIYVDSALSSFSNLENDSINWKVVSEDRGWSSDIVSAYSVESVPHNILISPRGIIRERGLAITSLEKKLKITE